MTDENETTSVTKSNTTSIASTTSTFTISSTGTQVHARIIYSQVIDSADTFEPENDIKIYRVGRPLVSSCFDSPAFVSVSIFCYTSQRKPS